MVFFFLITIIASQLPAYSEEPPPILTVESYLNLSKDILNVNIDNLNSLIGLIQTLSKEDFVRIEYEHSENLKNTISDLYNTYNTTSEEYVFFNGKNKRAIESYLENNPDVDQSIKDLSAQFDNLLDEYENLLVSKGIRES